MSTSPFTKKNNEGKLQLMSTFSNLSVTESMISLSDGRVILTDGNLNLCTFVSLIAKLRTFKRPRPKALDLLKEIQNAILFDKTKEGQTNKWNVSFWNNPIYEIKNIQQAIRIPQVMKEILDCISQVRQKIQGSSESAEATHEVMYRSALHSIAMILMEPRCKEFPEPKIRSSLFIWLRKIIDFNLISMKIDHIQADHHDPKEVATSCWLVSPSK